jgi:mRNA interferase MazF
MVTRRRPTAASRDISYIPRRGDLVWISFSPQAGHEQAGRRPAIVLSPESYNAKIGLALVCPVTSRIKGFVFEVGIPPGLPASGVILADQVRSLDWRERRAEFICPLPGETVHQALHKASLLLKE